MYLPSKIRSFGLLWLLLEGLALAGMCPPAIGAVTITPVVVEVASDGRAKISVRNDRSNEMLYQITMMRWRLEDGIDHYEITQDFIASPPLFTLASAATQIVRIGLRNPVRMPVEQAYRLGLAEVPGPSDNANERGSVAFSMQYSIPVFVASNTREVKRNLIWEMHAEGDTMVLRAENPSQSRVVLTIVGLTSQPGLSPAAEVESRQRSTVLAHSWREWRLQVPPDKLSLPLRIVMMRSDSDAAMIVPNDDMRMPSTR